MPVWVCKSVVLSLLTSDVYCWVFDLLGQRRGLRWLQTGRPPACKGESSTQLKSLANRSSVAFNWSTCLTMMTLPIKNMIQSRVQWDACMVVFFFSSELFPLVFWKFNPSKFFVAAQRGQQRSGLFCDCDGDVHQSWPHCGHVCCRSGEAGPRPGTNLKYNLCISAKHKQDLWPQKKQSTKLHSQYSLPVRYLTGSHWDNFKEHPGVPESLPKDVLWHNKMITESSLWSHRIDLCCVFVFCVHLYIYLCMLWAQNPCKYVLNSCFCQQNKECNIPQ